MFVDTEIALIAEVDGKPAAMCFAIPDVNELVKDFDGELMKRPLNSHQAASERRRGKCSIRTDSKILYKMCH